MAEQSLQDVVNQTQSVGDTAPTDVSANDITLPTAPLAVANTSASNDTDKSFGSPYHHHTVNKTHGQVGKISLQDGPAGSGDVLESNANSKADQLVSSPYVNGILSTFSEHEQEDGKRSPISKHTGTEGSVDSDTDASKAEPGESTDRDGSDGRFHARSDSLKKPTTFKAVSVTKNFLAKAITGSTPAAQINGDKSTPSTASMSVQAALRPRLVAKTGSGQRALAPKPANNGSRKGSGPDPLQVWNRNRPTPPAPPKHFTDEELKQQYGIHLATRLQADGDGKESKWADIDDDEDDWAPDTIEWNDGTKITLGPSDSNIAMVEEQAAALVAKDVHETAAKAEPRLKKPTSSVGPNATVLKVGASAQPKAAGLVLKQPSEKPTLVSKPSASTTVKSPWAPLPPVDKVAPIAINPQQPSPSQFQTNDPHGFDSMPPQPSSAKEIAADDFTRSWRESQNPRELYNSQSGRYEPVKEARRGSTRHDQVFRAPSLLQRPSHGDQGHAEPSAAFQTNRSGSQQEDGPRRRRRTSSNLSGENPQGRRISFSEANQQRRESIREQSPESHASQGNLGSRSSLSAQRGPIQQQQSPSSSISFEAQNVAASGSPADSPQLANTGSTGSQPSPLTSAEAHQNALMQQKQMMREKRELAIKRKKEEEEREEAAKRERIRLKMEKLGMPPLAEKEEPRKEKEKPSSSIIQPLAYADQSSAALEKALAPTTSEPVNHIDAGESTIEPPPETVSKSSEAFQEEDKGPNESQVNEPPRSDDSVQHPAMNGVLRKREEAEYPPRSTADKHEQTSTQEPKQPWTSIQPSPETRSGWSSKSMTTHSPSAGNLWGPPTTNSPSLGNGTFDRSIQRSSPRQAPYQQQTPSPTPQPIGPPKTVQRTLGPSEPRQVQGTLSKARVEDTQTVPTFPSPEAPSLTSPGRFPSVNNPDRNRTVVANEGPSPVTLPPPINHDKRPRDLEAQKASISAWNNFQTTSREEAEKARNADKANGTSEETPQLPIMKETWRQVKIDEHTGQRYVYGVTKSSHIPPGSASAPQANRDVRESISAVPSQFSSTGTRAMNAVGAGRGSRFFPNLGQGVLGQTQRSTSHTIGFDRSPSPPPPDSIDHPAFISTNRHPLVNLPMPKPKVKLPPSAKLSVQSPINTELRVAQLRAASQPLVSNPTWQARINGLLSRPSPEKKSVEFSSTKLPLDVISPQEIALSVSLPPNQAAEIPHSLVTSTGPCSKDVEEEEALFEVENREFGSLPPVRIPPNAPSALWIPALPAKSHRPRSRLFKEVEVTSVESLQFITLTKGGAGGRRGIEIVIKLPGMKDFQPKILPQALPQGSHRDHMQKNTVGVSKPPRKAPKPRESTGILPGTKAPQSAGQTGSMRALTQATSAQQGKSTYASNNAWPRPTRP